MKSKTSPSAGGAKITYSTAGVDVKKVKGIQDKVNALIASTHNSYSIPFAGHYAGLYRHGGSTFTIHADGVGSKVLVAQELGIYDTVGIDAVAMNVNDLVCIGSKPIIAVDYLALAKPDETLILEIMKGLVEGCRQSGVALIGGETAIMPDVIKGKSKPFDLALTCVGLLEGHRMAGQDMLPGDVLVGLESSGLHSNGFTLARRLLDAKKFGHQMLEPTKIYSNAALEMARYCEIHGIAHITGGAFSKLARIGSHAKTGFLLDSMPAPKGIFTHLAKKLPSDYELYRTFNMGIGMVVACPESNVANVQQIAKKHSIGSSVIGNVVKGSDVVLETGGKRISLL